MKVQGPVHANRQWFVVQPQAAIIADQTLFSSIMNRRLEHASTRGTRLLVSRPFGATVLDGDVGQTRHRSILLRGQGG